MYVVKTENIRRLSVFSGKFEVISILSSSEKHAVFTVRQFLQTTDRELHLQQSLWWKTAVFLLVSKFTETNKKTVTFFVCVHTFGQLSWFWWSTKKPWILKRERFTRMLNPTAQKISKTCIQDQCHHVSIQPNVKYGHCLPFCCWVMGLNYGKWRDFLQNIIMSRWSWPLTFWI